jgi:hypothetical protein
VLYTLYLWQRQWHLERARVGGSQTQRRTLRAAETRGCNGRQLEWEDCSGKLRPSSDLPTHRVLDNAFPEVGVVGPSEYATAWAQARKYIPCFGTTHADSFHGPDPEFTGTRLAIFPPVDDTGGRFSFLSRYW